MKIQAYLTAAAINIKRLADGLLAILSAIWTARIASQGLLQPREAAPACLSREAGLDRLDDARRSVPDHERGIAEAAPRRYPD